eukprot:4559639-Ditylum_brightwellii.AAC.1
MRYPSKAVGKISDSRPLSSTSIIDVWAKAMSVVHQTCSPSSTLLGCDVGCNVQENTGDLLVSE